MNKNRRIARLEEKVQEITDRLKDIIEALNREGFILTTPAVLSETHLLLVVRPYPRSLMKEMEKEIRILSERGDKGKENIDLILDHLDLRKDTASRLVEKSVDLRRKWHSLEKEKNSD